MKVDISRIGCKSATWNGEQYTCEVSGDKCLFLIPSSKVCAEVFGEGPDAYPDDKCENCQGFKIVDNKRGCCSTWGRYAFSTETILSEDTVLIDEDITSCGGFKRKEENNAKL